MKTVLGTITAAAVAAILISSLVSVAPSEARRGGVRGSRGAIGGFTRAGAYGQSAGFGGRAYGRGAAGAAGGRWAGPNGGSLAAGGGRVLGKKAGLAGGAWKGTGPNGGSGQGYGVGGYRRGVGGFEKTATQLKGPGGSTYNGFTQGKYNAQTGQGTYDSSRQVYDAKNGKDYGYTNDTTYTKGQGGTTTIDTQNKGDYTVDWQKGQKPVVTPVTTSGQ